MNNPFFKGQMNCSPQKVSPSGQEVSEITVEPTVKAVYFRYKRLLPVLIGLICIVVISVTLLWAFSGNNLFMAGLGTSTKESSAITHSLKNEMTIEKDGATHKILSAYIKNGRIYLDIIYYQSDKGITFQQQYEEPIGASDSPVDYWVYYNGEKCADYERSYGSVISVSYKLPVAKKDEIITVALYAGNNKISEISLIPVDDIQSDVLKNQDAVFKDIQLSADVRTEGNQVKVHISAVLPKNANPDTMVNQCMNGFSEQDIYIQDMNGTVYQDKSMLFFDKSLSKYISPSENEKADDMESMVLHRSYHYFYFDLPENIKSYRIIIPQIAYMTDNHAVVEQYGPWEMNITK